MLLPDWADRLCPKKVSGTVRIVVLPAAYSIHRVPDTFFGQSRADRCRPDEVSHDSVSKRERGRMDNPGASRGRRPGRRRVKGPRRIDERIGRGALREKSFEAGPDRFEAA